MNPLPFFPFMIALGLLAACVIIHAALLVLLLRWYNRLELPHELSYGKGSWLLVRVAWWTVLAHLAEMAIWAAAYVWLGLLPSLEVAAYFSIITYTTIGYGDVLLPSGWHLLAGVEGLTGILMAGWSTAILFALINRLLLRADGGRYLRQQSGG